MSMQAVRQFGTRDGYKPPAPATDRPIDLVHLSRQTLGDRALETELLSLFERQAAQAIERLQQPNGNGERRWRHDLAHTLKGSARAVGAGRVAAAAQSYEEALFSSTSEMEISVVLAELAAAVEEARKAALEFVSEA